ncbi:uncharacterized protein LOC135496790 [Lineus longissimus]|uniref:uncharacterized protein LOC135496790 n=1 Tax=Lineus longissimus TaxID=88925 RepID=UPI00315D39C4
MPNNKVTPVEDDSSHDSSQESSDEWTDSDANSECTNRTASIADDSLFTHDKIVKIIREKFCNVDPVSSIGRKLQIAKVVSVPLLPMVVLVIQTAITIYGVVFAKEELGLAVHQLNEADIYNRLTSSFARERMDNLLYLTTNKVNRAQLTENFIQTDKDLARANQPWEPVTYGNKTYTDKEHFHVYLWTYRADTWLRRYGDHVLTIINFYHAAGASFSKTVIRLSLENHHENIWRKLVSRSYILRAIEDVSMMQTLGRDILLHARFHFEEYIEYIEYEELWRVHVTLSRRYSDEFNKLYNKGFLKNTSGIADRVDEISEQILLKNTSFSGQGIAEEWEVITRYIGDTLVSIADIIKNETLSAVASELKNSDTEVVALGCVLAFVVILLPIVTLIAYSMVATITEFSMDLIHHSEELLEEKRQTEAILHRMLPETIAKQLKKRKTVDAEVFEGVTIFFSDVVGFTAISSQSTPMQVVDFLNKLYQFFDNVLERYDVYKVETIGDAYMVASGVPRRNGDRHANEIASISLDLRDGIERMQIPHMVTHKLQLRIGLHSGPCVAGVVGNKMPRYCLFGHTVQIASKMESTGVAQKIQITLACKERLDKLAGHVYITERRDVIQLEGIGEVERYFLIGRRDTMEAMDNRQQQPKESKTNQKDKQSSDGVGT